MVLCNLLDDGSSHSRLLIGPSESMRGGTLGTNPRRAVFEKSATKPVTQSISNAQIHLRI
jgi:hypothetical protein